MNINTLWEELINVIKWKYFSNIIVLTSLTLPIILSALGLLIGLYRKYSSEKKLHVYQTKEDKIKLKNIMYKLKGDLMTLGFHSLKQGNQNVNVPPVSWYWTSVIIYIYNTSTSLFKAYYHLSNKYYLILATIQIWAVKHVLK